MTNVEEQPKTSNLNPETLSKFGNSWLIKNGVLTKTVINSIVISIYSLDKRVKKVEMAIDKENKLIKLGIWVTTWAILLRKMPKILSGCRMVLKDYLSATDFKFEIEWSNVKFYRQGQE